MKINLWCFIARERWGGLDRFFTTIEAFIESSENEKESGDKAAYMKYVECLFEKTNIQMKEYRGWHRVGEYRKNIDLYYKSLI